MTRHEFAEDPRMAREVRRDMAVLGLLALILCASIGWRLRSARPSGGLAGAARQATLLPTHADAPAPEIALTSPTILPEEIGLPIFPELGAMPPPSFAPLKGVRTTGEGFRWDDRSNVAAAHLPGELAAPAKENGHFTRQMIVSPSAPLPAHPLTMAEALSPGNREIVRAGYLEPTPPADAKLRTYIVKPGDTLFAIAQRELGQASRYVEIVELNRRLGADIYHPHAGMKLALPADQK